MAYFLAALYARVPRFIEIVRALKAAEQIVRIEMLAKDEGRLRNAYDYLREQEDFD